MWYIYTMEYYSAIKNNEFMKFLGKWMELESVILIEVTQSQGNTQGMHVDISPEAPDKQDKIHRHMKLKNKEGQSMDASILLRRGKQNSHGRK